MRKQKSIYLDFVKHHGKKFYPEIFNTLMELEGNVIEYKKPYIYANEEVYENINDLDFSVSPIK